MTFIFVFSLLAGGGMLFANFFRERFEKTLPVFVLALVTLLYLFGIFGVLSAGVVVSFIFSVGGLILSAFLIVIKKHRLDTIKRIFTPGFLAFFLLLSLLFILNWSKNFVEWDDFSHWGIMIKETFRLDKLYSVPESVLGVHKDYPPIVCLFEYWFLKIKGEYTEPAVFVSSQLFTLIFLLPAFENVHFKNIIKFLSVFAIIMVLPCVVEINLYSSIYIDVTVGVLFSYSLATAVVSKKNSNFDIINIVLGCLVLTLTKQIGFFFVAVVVLYLVLYSVYRFYIIKKRDGQDIPKRNLHRPAITVLCSFAALVVGKLSWGWYLNVCNVSSGQFSISQISISGILSLLKRTAPEYQIVTFKNFVSAIFGRAIVDYPFSFSYFKLFLIFIALTGLLWFVFRKSEYSVQIKIFSWTMFLAGIGYAGVILLLYIFSFGPYEGPQLASYERYMSTFFVGIACAMFLILTALCSKETEVRPMKSDISWLLLAAIICGVWMEPGAYSQMLPFRREDTIFSVNKVYSDTLDEIVDFEKDKVYLILQGTNGAGYWSIKYYANPLKTNGNFSWSIGSKASEGDVWTKPMSANEWYDILINENYDYVYVVCTNDSFINEFGSLFENQSDIQNNTIFRVDRQNQNGMILKKINR